MLFVRIGIIKVMNLKTAVFWDASPCSLIKIYQRLGYIYCTFSIAVSAD
jgi:hypothetical protein